MKKEYTAEDLSEAVENERRHHFAILNYLLNKHSLSGSKGGLNYEKAFWELEEYESYLGREL